MTNEFFYRVEESRYTEENGHKDVFIRAFPVLKTTPKGVWLNTGKWDVLNPSLTARKFVLRKNGKFAQPTQELAFATFKHRKQIHIAMMKWRLDVIEQVLARSEKEGFLVIVNSTKVDELVDAFHAKESP